MLRLTKEDKRIAKRMKEIRGLLKEFGLTLSGYDPGVMAILDREKPRYVSLSFDAMEWVWLESILVELRKRRKSEQR